jgi:COP9 signalosome complex subunit 1
MATALNTTVAALDKELAAGIADGRIAARIDARAGVLYARHADARRATFQRALAAGAAYERDTKALLVRASLMQHDVVQRGLRRDGGGHGGHGGHGGGGPHGPHGRGDPHFQRLGGDHDRQGIARAHASASADML